MIDEKCWDDAHLMSVLTSRPQVECYEKLIQERKTVDLESQLQQEREKRKEAETANARVKELEQAEADRKQAQKDAEIEADLKNRFSRAAGENKFKHADIENGRFNAFKQALSDENFKGKGDSEIFAEVTKDMDCFVNPQQQTVTMPGGGNTTPTKAEFKSFF